MAWRKKGRSLVLSKRVCVCARVCVCVCAQTGGELEDGPLPSLWCPREGCLPQRLKGRLAFLFKEREGIPFLDKGKELLAPALFRISAVLPLKRVTDIRQRLWMVASEATQDKKRTTHGSTEGCHERWELFKEELPGAQPQSQPLPKQCAQGVQGTLQPHQGPNTGQEGKNTKPYTRPSVLRAAPTSTEWQCANCAQTNWMTRKECRQCHKMPPGPSNPMPPKEVASGSTVIPTQLGRT